LTALFAKTPDGVRLFIRVLPGAGRNAIAGTAEDADGQNFLKVMVTAAPENGKANAAVIKLLSKTWKLPKSAIRVVSGSANRRKTLEITGDSQLIAAAIARATEQ
jgi:uncharacterized protein